MNIWMTADEHLGHYNPTTGNGVIKYCNRPFTTIEEHDEYLIEQHNKYVKKGDKVFILGDMAWRNHKYYCNRLNGNKILITGSHDKISQLDRNLFVSIHEGMLNTKINNTYFTLTHCSMCSWEKSHYGSINLYGHSHGRHVEDEYHKQMDVGVDVSPNNYAPFNLDFILYKMSLKKEIIHDSNNNGNDNMITNRNINSDLMSTFSLLQKH